MARGIHRLTAAALRRTGRGLHFDGGGLALQITPARDGDGFSRSWIFRWTRGGKTRSMGLGSIITVSLAEAREAALQCRKKLHSGIDPLEARNAERSTKAAASIKAMSFEQAAAAYAAAHRSEWRSKQHAGEWATSLAKHIFPILGKLNVAAIDTAAVIKALQPIWERVPETASRLRGRIEAVLDWSAVAGLRQGDNPARWGGHLEHLLAAPAKRQVRHLAAMPWRDLPDFMAKLRASDSTSSRALEFTILTAARAGETLGATWAEIDLATKTWTVPAGRMKSGKEHRVPLSPRAVALLGKPATGRLFDVGENALRFVLRAATSDGTKAARDLTGGGATVHGFRSSFRDWCGERTNFARELAEMALAHAVGSKVEQAYQRSDMFEKRRRLMQAWADFCSRPVAQQGATVTHLMKARARP
jgi:integrase